MKHHGTISLVLGLSIASPAMAFSDGTLGPTSNGTFQVTAVISSPAVDNVQITGLDDVTFTGTTDEGDLPMQPMIFCMVRQPGGGDIGVTMSSISAGDSAFAVRSSTTGETVPLTVYLQSMSGVYQKLSEGVESTFSAPSSCTESNSSEYSQFNIYLDDGDGATPSNLVPGTFSNTFLISIAPK